MKLSGTMKFGCLCRIMNRILFVPLALTIRRLTPIYVGHTQWFERRVRGYIRNGIHCAHSRSYYTDPKALTLID